MRFVFVVSIVLSFTAEAETLRVGSKRFTESYILGEILVQSAARAGVQAEHKPGLGNTAILYEALKSGAIDLYPEYLGTIAREILKTGERLDLAALNERLARLGLAASVPLGFSNTYAIGVRNEIARKLGLKKISDLAGHGSLRFGLSHEFLGRRDGWPGLKSAYALAQADPRGLDHGLAYEALAAGEIDVMDIYSTDAKIARYGIVVLEDDRKYFPSYEAVLLYRAGAERRFASAFSAFRKLEHAFDQKRMIALNARAELEKIAFADVAKEFLGDDARKSQRSLWQAAFAPDFARLLVEHLGLVFGSLAAAVAIGVPLGLAAAKVPVLSQPVLVLAGLLQTIPSLALLAFLIPLTGTIGLWPALIALFLYALLPIARNTHAGLMQIDRGLVQAGVALGLRAKEILLRIEFPLALPTILAGVKTSAVINVGTATIAAFIGAGGFGERISQGLALNDHVLLLAGALPAAALALLVHAAFELGERLLLVRNL
jgi:osmoprotectant transport system permease protein